MNKVKLLTLISIILLIVNIVLLFFLFNRKPPRHEGPKKEIIEMLHFDAAQVAAYELLIKTHQEAMSKEEQVMNQLKAAYYAQLSSNTSVQKDSLLHLLGEKQMLIEQINYKHFEDIKHLCKPDQLGYFQKFSAKVSDLFEGRRRRPNHRR